MRTLEPPTSSVDPAPLVAAANATHAALGRLPQPDALPLERTEELLLGLAFSRAVRALADLHRN